MNTIINPALPEYKRKTVLRMGLRILFYCSVLAGITGIVFLDAQHPDFEHRFSEQSMTEYAQELLLLLTILVFLLCYKFFPDQEVITYLVGGFLGMAFIREYDAFLDSNVADGFWPVLAYSLAAICAYLIYKQRNQFWDQLEGFIQNRAFGIFITGLMIVFIFSRLYGYNLMWETVMGENYMYVVTRASEEAIELLGYTLIFLGATEYFFSLRNLHERYPDKADQLLNA